MRTTVTLEPDVAAEVERIRREQPSGVSAVVNDLIRRGLAAPQQRAEFVQMTSAMGARMDISNVGEVLETLEYPTAQ